MKKAILLLLVAAAGLALLAGGYLLVTEVLFGPSSAVRAALKSDSQVRVNQLENRAWLVFQPAQTPVKGGLIAYPENYQDIRMYAPLCQRIAREGYIVVMLSRAKRMPPTIDEEVQRVTAVMQAYQGQTERWFLGAHSWEANVAAAVANRNPQRYAGVVMWAGRLSPETSLAGSGLPVLQVYGTRDEQNENLMANNRAFLPAGAVYVAIEGGNRVGFADFGPMPRDVGASITPQEQQEQTAAATVSFMEKVLAVSTPTDAVPLKAQSTQDIQGEEKQVLARTVEGILVEVASAKIIDTGVEIEICYATQDGGDWYPMFSHLFFGTYEVYPDEFDFLTEDRADGSKFGKRCVAVRYKIEEIDTITPPIQFGIEELYAVPREGHACERLQERLDTNPKAKAYDLKVKCSQVENSAQLSVELVDHNKAVDKGEAKKVLGDIVQGSLTGPWTFIINETQR